MIDYQGYYDNLREEQEERRDREWAKANGLDPDGQEEQEEGSK